MVISAVGSHVCTLSDPFNKLVPGLSNYTNMASGVHVADECLTAYSDLQIGHKYKYIILKLSDDQKEIVVDKCCKKDGAENPWEEFEQYLKGVAKDEGQGRYAVYDMQVEEEGALKDRVCFINWVPDSLNIKQKMLYTSSKQALKAKLVGVHAEMQCNDENDLCYDEAVNRCKKVK